MNPFAAPPSLRLPLNTPIHLFPIPASLSNPHPKPLHPSPPRPYSKLPLPASLSPLSASPTSFPYSFPDHFQREPNHEDEEHEEEDEDDDDHAIGDCLVFEDGAFEGVADPFLRPDPTDRPRRRRPAAAAAAAAAAAEVNPETLIPEKWKEAAAELNLTKKEKRKMAHQLRFGSRVERRKKLPMPDIEEYRAYREMKMAQLKPVVLDDPRGFLSDEEAATAPQEMEGPPRGGRVAPRNPRLALGGGTMEDITDFFNSGYYLPGELNDDKKPQGSRKLLTKEEKILLNKRIPNLADATSNKWMPLHTLAASGEFYLLDLLLKHNVDINAVDKDGLSAIHRAIIGKKQAIVNYLLRNAANPFVRDTDGATLIHHAVQTASSQTIKILLLYNIDINAADNDGWTPLHLAVQTQRTDIVRLLLIKGADMTLKNRDGLTPLDLCLYSGHGMRTYEIIKLLKKQPKPKLHP